MLVWSIIYLIHINVHDYVYTAPILYLFTAAEIKQHVIITSNLV